MERKRVTRSSTFCYDSSAREVTKFSDEMPSLPTLFSHSAGGVLIESVSLTRANALDLVHALGELFFAAFLGGVVVAAAAE